MNKAITLLLEKINPDINKILKENVSIITPIPPTKQKNINFLNKNCIKDKQKND